LKYLLALLLFSCNLYGQDRHVIKGKVISSKEPVPSATVSTDSSGTLTDLRGEFTVLAPSSAKFKLHVTAIGYSPYHTTISATTNDTIFLTIELIKKDISLNEVQITEERQEMVIRDSTVRMEVYSGALLKRNAPENLMQLISSINGVQEQLNCGVCNTSDIHINGLEGPNTLVLIDGMPIVSALSTSYGMSGISTAIIERVEVTRGPASAFYGADAIAGTINVVTKSPLNSPKFDAGTFVSSQLEKNGDLTYTNNGSKHSFLVTGSLFEFNSNIDRNLDGFTDIARGTRGSLFLKSSYHPNDRMQLNSGVRVYSEERWGGQLNWNRSFRGSDSVYGEWIDTKRVEAFSSLLNSFSTSKLKTDLSCVYHQQESFYGTNSFNADQLTLYTSVRYEVPVKKSMLVAGLSQRTNLYHDNTAVSGGGNSFLPGLFAEQEFRMFNKKLKVMPGARLDYFVSHGVIVSPRFNSSLKTGKFSLMQFSAGRGFRVVSVFTEDHAALTGSRSVIIAEKLNPESSWTSSLSFRQAIGVISSTVEVNAFYTYFTNQIIPDYTVPDKIIYSNLQGYSVSRGVSLNIFSSFKFPLKLNLGTTILNAFENDNNSISPILFSPEYTAVSQITYTVPFIKTEISLSSKLNGPMALPEYPEPYSRATRSPVFTTHNIQLMKRIKAVELSFSIKNVLDYMQPTPLIDPARPFSESFDTTYIYGPLQGRRFVLAVRFTRF
jgi:outer membrane receptor for ferrienterochelin and colicins